MSIVVEPRIIAWILGQVLLALAGTMLVPLGYGIVLGGMGLAALVPAVIITALVAVLVLAFSHERPGRELRQREAILLVVLVWVSVCLFGALPLYFSPYFATFTDALFEATSGFTTTGATILGDIEALSRPVQLWRCLTHWLGGMGIVLLGVAILPLVGQGGMHLYRAEFSGAKSQRLRPRVMETAQALWKIYVALTLAEFLALLGAGMGVFDALCHSFSTIATGGFSTRTASIGAFDSAAIEYIVIVFMLLGGISFVQFYRLLLERQPRSVIQDFELRWYFLIVAVTTVLIAAVFVWEADRAWEPAFRDALFQVTAIVTTTGFATDDFAAWYPLAQLILLMLMFMGGCTGSTAGGLKVARVVLLGYVVNREFRRMAEPQGVFSVRLGGEATSETTISGLLNLVYLGWLANFFACLLLAASGVDVFTSLTAVVACIFNIGPGLGAVGPMENYGHLPTFAKWVLAVCMVAGRLEFYTLLVIFTVAFWRR